MNETDQSANTESKSHPGLASSASREHPRNGSKAALRLHFRTQLKAISFTERALGSAQACVRLKENIIWARSHSILFYDPLPDEVDVWPLLAEALASGRDVCLPRYVPHEDSYVASRLRNPQSDLIPGKFGIREAGPDCPVVSLNQLDLVLVPGISFDLNGHRLGRGQGYYDRLLPAVRGTKCGLAFDRQIAAAIPAEPHDVALDYLVTPTRCLAVPARTRT
jgi:5-formyltetrahydrofolate cyclo-ligase